MQSTHGDSARINDTSIDCVYTVVQPYRIIFPIPTRVRDVSELWLRSGFGGRPGEDGFPENGKRFLRYNNNNDGSYGGTLYNRIEQNEFYS